MSLTDPVADFLARIRNAIRARHQKLDVPASKLKSEIARTAAYETLAPGQPYTVSGAAWAGENVAAEIALLTLIINFAAIRVRRADLAAAEPPAPAAPAHPAQPQ